MTWIRSTPPDQADADLLRIYQEIYSLYPAEYAQEVAEIGSSDSIVAAHSLIPEAMRHMMNGLGVLLQPTLPLSRRQHEMIATVVSARNACFY